MSSDRVKGGKPERASEEQTVPRIPLLSATDALTPEQRRVYEAVTSGPRGAVEGPLRAALHRPDLADKWQQLGELLRFRTSLPARLSELAILVTARHWTCQLEWHLHSRLAREAGLEAGIIEAVRTGRRPETADEEVLAIYDYSAELQATTGVVAETHRRVVDRWGVVGVVELTALIGYYTMVAMTLNAHLFPLPDGVDPPLGPLPADFGLPAESVPTA